MEIATDFPFFFGLFLMFNRVDVITRDGNGIRAQPKRGGWEGQHGNSCRGELVGYVVEAPAAIVAAEGALSGSHVGWRRFLRLRLVDERIRYSSDLPRRN